MDKYEKIINSFRKLNPNIDKTINDFYEETGSEEILFTCLFGDIGACIFNIFEDLNNINKKEIFELIEIGMDDTDEKLRTAVATGLIEALINQASQFKEKEILDCMYPKSKEYALAYIDFWNNH